MKMFLFTVILLLVVMVNVYVLIMKYDSDRYEECLHRDGILVKSFNGWTCVKEIP